MGDAGASAVIFAMGVPADDVVGLPEKQFDVACEGTPLGLGFKAPSPLVADSLRKRLFVGDVDNRRILVFQLEADAGAPLPPPSAIAVIGQPNLFTCAAVSTPSDNNFAALSGLALDIDGGRLFAADSALNRVLVFDVRTLDAGLRAAYVLGQATMTARDAGLGAASMRAPAGLAYGVWADGGREGLLFVADKGNNRILAFDVNPAGMTDAGSAVAVIGQPNFNTGDASSSPTRETIVSSSLASRRRGEAAQPTSSGNPISTQAPLEPARSPFRVRRASRR
jgi:DNA-binding beta-propeller fold protein YncE